MRARVFEDAEVDAFLMWLERPGDSVVLPDLDPAHYVTLNRNKSLVRGCVEGQSERL